MAYADPQTTHNPTTGQIIPASWGDIVRDDLEYLARNKPHARVYNSAAISLPTGAVTALTFNSERYDIGACHSTSSNTSRLTVPSGEAGKYLIGATVGFAANPTGYRAILLQVNGVTTIAQQDAISLGAGSAMYLSICTENALAAGDYVELKAFQNSGGNLNALASGNYSPEFWWEWVAI